MASEASEISDKNKKKVMGAEHVVDALSKLGFEAYLPEVTKAVDEVKEESKVRARGLAQAVGAPTASPVCAGACVCARAGNGVQAKLHKRSAARRPNMSDEDAARIQEQLLMQARLKYQQTLETPTEPSGASAS